METLNFLARINLRNPRFLADQWLENRGFVFAIAGVTQSQSGFARVTLKGDSELFEQGPSTAGRDRSQVGTGCRILCLYKLNFVCLFSILFTPVYVGKVLRLALRVPA